MFEVMIKVFGVYLFLVGVLKELDLMVGFVDLNDVFIVV